ncbi:MAG: MFS transporter [Asgard group archaeon]|nr:MFS transporter [Asgard group archaeon]
MNSHSRTESKNGKKINLKTLEWLSFEKGEFIIILSMFFYHLGVANFAPYAPLWLFQIFEEQSFVVIGLVSIIPNAMVIVGTLLWGFLADRTSIKWFVVGGLVFMGLMYTSLIFSKNSAFFLIMIFVGYFFGSAQSANYYALGTTITSKPKEVILGKISAITSIAWIIMSPISGALHDNYEEDAMDIQLIIAAVACLIAIILAILVKEKRALKEETNHREEINKTLPITTFPKLFIITLILAFFMQSTMGGFWAYNTIYFIETLKVKAIHYSIFLVATTTIAIPLSFIFGNITSSRAISKTAIIYIFIQNLVFLFMSIFPMNAILAMILYSIPVYPFYTVCMYSLVANFTSKERRATAYGIFSSIGILGVVLGILILGVVADSSSLGIFIMLRYSLAYAFLTLVITFILYFLIKRNSHIDKENLNDKKR